MRELVDCLGVNVHGGQHIDEALAIGIRAFRLDSSWNLLTPSRGVYDFSWLDPVMQKIQDAGAVALLVSYATPAWEDPTWPVIAEWSGPPAIPIMREEWIPDWQDFVNALSNRYPWAEFNVATETNLTKYWEDPDHPGENGSARRYADLVLRPAADLLKLRSCRILTPGTTMRGERRSTWLEALVHLSAFTPHPEWYDRLDVHLYREYGDDTVSDIQRLLRLFDTMPTLNISEIGFNDRHGEVEQLRNWQTVLDFMQFNQSSERIERIYAYHWWSGANGLLRDDGSMKPVAQHIARRLAGQYDPPADDRPTIEEIEAERAKLAPKLERITDESDTENRS